MTLSEELHRLHVENGNFLIVYDALRSQKYDADLLQIVHFIGLIEVCRHLDAAWYLQT